MVKCEKCQNNAKIIIVGCLKILYANTHKKFQIYWFCHLKCQYGNPTSPSISPPPSGPHISRSL